MSADVSRADTPAQVPGVLAELPPGPIPSPLGVRAIGFVFLALVEYWVAPALFGVANLAGVWALLGQVLFVAWTAALGVFVGVPLFRRVQPALSSGRSRALFFGTWSLGLALGLLATNTVGTTSPAPGTGSIVLGTTTVYTPFGAWPSLTIALPSLGVAGSLDVVSLTVLGFLGFLSASILTLSRERAGTACPPTRVTRAPWRSRVASFALWAPIGLLSGCPACTPLYLSAVGLAAPGVAAGGYSFLPFAPWGAFAGLVYLASVAFAVAVVRRLTSGPWIPGPDVRRPAEGA